MTIKLFRVLRLLREEGFKVLVYQTLKPLNLLTFRPLNPQTF